MALSSLATLFGQADSADCPFCGVADSIKHRVLECPHFQSARELSSLSRQQLEALQPAQRLHCWAPAFPGMDAIRSALAGIPARFQDFHPHPVWSEYHLFVDGSCLRPDTPALRLAAWAVTLAPLGDFSPSLPVADGLVPGTLQSAYRAELCAMLSALLFAAKVGRKVWIWSDCLGIVSKVRRWLQGAWVPTQRTRHYDLWCQILSFLHVLQPLVSVCKVVSHLDPSLEKTAGDEWCAFHNNQVDRAAANAQLAREESFWDVWQALCCHWDREVRIAKEVMALHVRIGHRAVVTRQPLVFNTPSFEHLPLSPCTLGQFAAQRGQKVLRRYGEVAVRKLEQWSACLRCPDEPIRWISTVQLFIGFALKYGHPQVLRDGAWVDLATTPNGQLVQVPFVK